MYTCFILDTLAIYTYYASAKISFNYIKKIIINIECETRTMHHLSGLYALAGFTYDGMALCIYCDWVCCNYTKSCILIIHTCMTHIHTVIHTCNESLFSKAWS